MSRSVRRGSAISFVNRQKSAQRIFAASRMFILLYILKRYGVGLLLLNTSTVPSGFIFRSVPFLSTEDGFIS